MLASLLIFVSVGGTPNITGDALAPYRGQPVLSVDVEAPEDVDTEELRSLIAIQPGYLLATDAIQSSIKRLYALGRFSDVGVTAERLSGTVSLHFYVRPIRRLQQLDIRGTDLSDEAALFRALKLRSGDEVDRRTAATLTRRAVTYLRNAGFPRASIRITEAAEGTSVSFKMTVSEGEPLRLRAIQFTGRPRVSRSVLQDLVALEVGGVLDLTVLKRDVQNLRRAYQKHGFLQAKVSAPVVEAVGASATVTFPIWAGARIAVELRDSTLLTLDDVLQMWPTTDTPLQPEDLTLLADRITTHYRRLGFADVRVRVRRHHDPATESTRFLLQIKEGSPFSVTETKFVGAHAIPPRILQAQVVSLLRRELDDESLFHRLSAADRCLANATSQITERRCPAPTLPPERRWVPELYETAIEEIAAAYRNLGFLSVRVGPVEPTVNEHRVRVRIPLEEGPQTTISSISFRGNEAFRAPELLALVEGAATGKERATPQRPGAPFSAEGIEDARIAILHHYRDLGYVYARAFSEIQHTAKPARADIVFHIEEGPQVRVERVLLRGNRYTRDSIIRSRLSIRPGDIYRLDRALADQRAVAELGVFSNVRVKLIDEEFPAERKDLVAEVVERNRQPVEVSFGISSADGPRLRSSYSHINVLGTASTFTGSLRLNRQVFFDLYDEYRETMLDRYERFDALSQLEREIRLGLRSPRFTTLPLDPSAHVDLVHERENAISYSLDSISFIFGLDFFPWQGLKVGLAPQVSLIQLECVEKDYCAKDVRGARYSRRPIEAGLRRMLKIGPSVSYDRVDNPFSPTRGFVASTKAIYAVGRQETQPFSFTRAEATLKGYIPAGKSVLAMLASAGTINVITGTTPIDERFFLGGRGTLRGFPEGGTLIPQDACVVACREENGENVCDAVPTRCAETIEHNESDPPVTKGGNFFFLFKTELRLPVTESLSVGFFVDVGNLWVQTPIIQDLPLRVGTGLGLRYATPVGPLAFDVGINTHPYAKFGESATPQPHFSVGVF